MARDVIGWPRNHPLASADCRGGVHIGLIHTAINPKHRAFADSRIEIIRLSDKVLSESGRQHGTAVAALLVGSADSGTPGFVPGGALIAVDAFYRAKRQDDRSEVYDLARAMDLLVERNVHVINMSLAGPANMLLEEVVRKLTDRNNRRLGRSFHQRGDMIPAYATQFRTMDHSLEWRCVLSYRLPLKGSDGILRHPLDTPAGIDRTEYPSQNLTEDRTRIIVIDEHAQPRSPVRVADLEPHAVGTDNQEVGAASRLP